MYFSDLLRVLMEEKRVSASALAAAMGIASKTSVLRVLHNTASIDYQADFLSRLFATDALCLTEEEARRLRDAIEISRLGREKYQSYRALDSMVTIDSHVGEPMRLVEYCADGTEKEGLLRDLLEQLVSENDRLEVYLTGWGHGTLMHEIRQALERPKRAQVDIRHYLCCTGRRFMEAMSSIMPVIYLRCYHPYGLKDDTIPLELRSFIANSSALIKMERNGQEQYMHIHVFEQDKCQMIRYDNPHVFKLHISVLERAKPWFAPVKTTFDQCGNPNDYMRYTEFFLHMEAGHPAYILLYDPCISFIHPDLLVQPATDGFVASGLYDKADVDKVVELFYGIHLQRWKAMFASDRPTHAIFSWKGMLKFVRTGISVSQFFAMRPFTPTERLAIMLELKRQVMENPYFHLYFTPMDSKITVDQIGFYENYGIYMCKGETDFDMKGEHEELVITEPDFCDVFKSYFMDTLLKKAVVSERRTLQWMDELIAIARSLMR